MGLASSAVDFVGMALAGTMTVVAAVICQSMFEFPHFDFSKVVDPLTAVLIVLPVRVVRHAECRNGFVASADMVRSLGFAWPIALVLIALQPTSRSATRRWAKRFTRSSGASRGSFR